MAGQHQTDTAPLSPDASLKRAHEAACSYRLARVRECLLAHQCDAVLLYDPVNIRYATDTSNMQVWTLHNAERYCLVFADGPVVLWEFPHCKHLHDGNGQLDEIRDAISFTCFSAGTRREEKALQWADSLMAVLETHAGSAPRLAIDHGNFDVAALLRKRGVALSEGNALMEQARRIKSADEITLMRWTINVAQIGIERMRAELQPGMTENELWAWLHFENIRHGGEWIETRLLCSGPRTNPWMRECSDRVMQEGEMLCFDTDLIGPFGYCADISRTWTVGHVPPTPAQAELYRLACEQVATNIALLAPGVSYRELSDRAWPIPAQYIDNRYCCLMHGVGLCDENPAIAHAMDWQRAGYDGELAPGMVLCVESYIGATGGHEGVKLEQQVLITDSGHELLSTSPLNNDWL